MRISWRNPRTDCHWHDALRIASEKHQETTQERGAETEAIYFDKDMSDSSIEIHGIDEINAKLEEMTVKAERSVLREGMKAAADVVTGAMQAEGSAAPGEIGEALADPGSWSRSISIRAGHSAETKIGPKGALPEVHVGRGATKTKTGWRGQPKGSRYRRSLQYLIKLMEFGGQDNAANLPKSNPMSTGFQKSQDNAVQAFITNLKDSLDL